MSLLRRFFRQEEGSVFAIVGLGILVLVGGVGVATDVGRGQMAQAKLQNAVDAAGLAAGASVSTADLQAEITKYVNVNFSQGTLGATITDVDYVLSEDNDLLTVDVTASMPTSFMRLFGHTTMNLSAHTEITRSNKGMELALVLDVTGSMCQPCSKLTALKAASHDLIDILFGDDATADNLWVGIVPFSQAVNVGNEHDDWIDATQDHNNLDWGPGGEWKGCLEARWEVDADPSNDPDVTAVTPATEKFTAYYWPDSTNSNNNWITTDIDEDWEYICHNQSSCRCSNYACGSTTTGNTTVTISCSGSGSGRDCIETTTITETIYTITSEKGPNRYCPNKVTTLTNTKATLTAAIDALATDGMTHIPTGAVWGWRMLDPGWKTWWGGTMESNNLPLAYNTDLMIKAVVIMTDGTNTMISNWDGAYGYLSQGHLGTTNSSTAADKLDAKLTSVCNAMKTSGIYVYTVLFQESDTGIQTLLRNCATVPDYFFNTTTGADLETAFAKIGDSLANLRISK